MVADTIQQQVRVITEENKVKVLLECIADWYDKGSILVFVDTQESTDILWYALFLSFFLSFPSSLFLLLFLKLFTSFHILSLLGEKLLNQVTPHVVPSMEVRNN